MQKNKNSKNSQEEKYCTCSPKLTCPNQLLYNTYIVITHVNKMS